MLQVEGWVDGEGESKKLMHIKIFQTTVVKLTEIYIQ
jgi:hypothetical protein